MQGDDIVLIPDTKQISYLKYNIDSLKVGLSTDELEYLDEVFHLMQLKENAIVMI